MRNKPRSITNSIAGALCTGGGCRGVQGRGFPLNLEHGRALALGIRYFFLSGYRCFPCVLQNAPCCVPDVLQISIPALVSSQALHVLKRSWRALQCPTKVLKDLTK